MPSKKKKFNARFPPARIKKIMQTDEDVGKVAAAVPVIISKTLELFIETLVTRAYTITQGRSAKTLTPSHVKQVIMAESKFDFLKDLVAAVPDTQNEEDEDPLVVETAVHRPRGRPRKSRGDLAAKDKPRKSKNSKKDKQTDGMDDCHAQEKDTEDDEDDNETDDADETIEHHAAAAATTAAAAINADSSENNESHVSHTPDSLPKTTDCDSTNDTENRNPISNLSHHQNLHDDKNDLHHRLFPPVVHPSLPFTPSMYHHFMSPDSITSVPGYGMRLPFPAMPMIPTHPMMPPSSSPLQMPYPYPPPPPLPGIYPGMPPMVVKPADKDDDYDS
ncbi:uncharacterized protein LOC141910984 isoform X2 [Tubulanus polymorphus]|uniref:uncharacterized protein LOC141910984 isoform X2 n=1 Tax=Tubulanus polymorphus TaxID=672921 RepID=UPI003DA2C5FC